MYVTSADGLGFSLKPPKWLRNIVGSAVKQTHVTVQTPAGPVTYDLGNPADVEAMKKMIASMKVNVGPQPPSAMDTAGQYVKDAVGSVPSWLWWAGGGAAALFLLPRLMPRARRNPHRRRRRG